MTLRISTIIFVVATLAVAVLGWLFLGPVQLGGSTGYVITKGSSMQPLIQQGDLVLLRKHSTYKVGDVVGYHNSELHHVVLHRIIAINGDKLTMKGDNNNFVDGQHPTMSDVVGEKWVRLPHVGSALVWVQKPTNAGILALGAMILAAAGTETVRKRKKPKGGPAAAQPKAPRRIGAAWIAPTVLLALSCVLGLAAFGRSTTTTVSQPGAYQQTGDFSSVAHTQPSVAYPTGLVTIHQTAFTRLVPTVQMSFRYMLSSLRPAAISGEKWMKLKLSSIDTGWSRTFTLADPTKFTGPTTVVRGTVSLSELAGVIAQLQKQTKILSTNYRVSILPSVHIKGAIGGQAVDKVFSSQLDFVFDGLKFGIDQGSGLAGATHSATHVMTIGTGDVQKKQSLDLKIVKMSVSSARTVALVGIVLALLVFVAVSSIAYRRRTADEPAIIERLYSHLLLPVSNLPQVDHVVDVDNMDALATLADRYDRSILHYHEGAEHTYLLQDEGVVYRYLVSENGRVSVEQVLPGQRPVAVAAPPSGGAAPPQPTQVQPPVVPRPHDPNGSPGQ
jgi:signal peptidase I